MYQRTAQFPPSSLCRRSVCFCLPSVVCAFVSLSPIHVPGRLSLSVCLSDCLCLAVDPKTFCVTSAPTQHKSSNMRRWRLCLSRLCVCVFICLSFSLCVCLFLSIPVSRSPCVCLFRVLLCLCFSTRALSTSATGKVILLYTPHYTHPFP